MKNLQLYHRKVIQRLIEEKRYSVAEIAEGLEVSPSTIYRELKRNTNPKTKKYTAEYAHKIYLARKKYAGSKKKNPFNRKPRRKNDYELYAERKYIYWYSDKYYSFKLKKRNYDFIYLKKWYAYRIGKKYFDHNNDWELYDLWMEHLKLLKEQRSVSASTPKYYWMRALIKNETTFTLWKNPSTAMEQKQCV
ncbi:HTH domain-containing protein [Flammeovirga pectinis]|uniref:HTH domain-containing protein n=1 Tax=Flammeovirga pectinis TaxID=2494373 RepID=A0A3S9P6G7_9BACT|nr:helix-turn-helix domain-containing protein [Flammeovirga pectinis]AZQ63815.1 HTH domain-containing protein [Flammeovirga pectinis]